MDFSHLAKMFTGAGAGGGIAMLLEFMGGQGLTPAITMGSNSVSLNSVLILAAVAIAIYWTKNGSKE
jgi:glycerate kinase